MNLLTSCDSHSLFLLTFFSQNKIGKFFFGLIKHHDTRTCSGVCALLPSAYFKCQNSRYPLNRSLPGHQSRSECCRKKNWILVNNKPDAVFHVFIYSFNLSTCFEHQVFIIRRSNCI